MSGDHDDLRKESRDKANDIIRHEEERLIGLCLLHPFHEKMFSRFFSKIDEMKGRVDWDDPEVKGHVKKTLEDDIGRIHGGSTNKIDFIDAANKIAILWYHACHRKEMMYDKPEKLQDGAGETEG